MSTSTAQGPGAGLITPHNFDKTQYGAYGFGMMDVEELLRRGHNYQEINDYVEGEKTKHGAQFGTGAQTWLLAEGRRHDERMAKRSESKARAFNYQSENQNKGQSYQDKDFTGGQQAMLANKFGNQDNSYKPSGKMHQKYDFSSKEY